MKALKHLRLRYLVTFIGAVTILFLSFGTGLIEYLTNDFKSFSSYPVLQINIKQFSFIPIAATIFLISLFLVNLILKKIEKRQTSRFRLIAIQLIILITSLVFIGIGGMANRYIRMPKQIDGLVEKLNHLSEPWYNLVEMESLIKDLNKQLPAYVTPIEILINISYETYPNELQYSRELLIAGPEVFRQVEVNIWTQCDIPYIKYINDKNFTIINTFYHKGKLIKQLKIKPKECQKRIDILDKFERILNGLDNE